MKILRERKIGFSRIDAFNDPYEATYETSFEESIRNTSPEMKDLLVDSIENDKKSKRFLRNELDTKCAVFCGSRVWNNLLMWAHYAEKFSGLVLGFGTGSNFLGNQYKGTLEECISLSHPKSMIKNMHVIYSNERPVLLMDTPEIELLHWKSRDWGYEEEWRVVMYDPERKENDYEKGVLEPIDKNDIKEVILGPKFNSDNIQAVEDIVKQNYTYVSIYKTMLDEDKFEIYREKIMDVLK